MPKVIFLNDKPYVLSQICFFFVDFFLFDGNLPIRPLQQYDRSSSEIQEILKKLFA